MSLVEFAKQELKAIGYLDGNNDFYEGMTAKAVLELIELFAKQGHSGMSASLVAGLFGKLAAYKPLSPLTGEDSEWMEVSEGVFQNKRCYSVFKDETGAYHSEGRVFQHPDGACFTNGDSRVYITFPYAPTTEYVDVPADD